MTISNELRKFLLSTVPDMVGYARLNRCLLISAKIYRTDIHRGGSASFYHFKDKRWTYFGYYQEIKRANHY